MDGAGHTVSFDSDTSISTVIETMGSSCCNPAFDGLENATRWVAWRTEPRGKEGKLTKVPKNPRTGHTLRAGLPAHYLLVRGRNEPERVNDFDTPGLVI